MTTIIADRILKELETNTDALFAAITIMDHPNVCQCKACTASAEKYNNSDAAAAVKFTNQINKKVQAGLQKKADKTGTKQLNACYNGCVIIPNEDVEVPSNLTELSWEEFGFSGGFKTTEGQRKVSVVESINNTLFNGDVCMPSGSWMRYAEGETNQIGGVYVGVNADGILTVRTITSSS